MLTKRKGKECHWEMIRHDTYDTVYPGFEEFWKKWEHCFKENI